MTDRAELLGEFYAQNYSRTAVSAQDSVFSRYLHSSLEMAFGPEQSFKKLLEVGGNRGEHVPFVRHAYDDYLLTDLRLPVPTGAAAEDPRVHVSAVDAGAIPHDDHEFDRVIVTCLLHHVDDPLQVAEELRRVVRPGGVVSILVPTDPGLAYRTAQRLTSARAAKRQGIGDKWKLVHAMDHRNHFRSIDAQLRSAFAKDSFDVSWLPMRVASVELNVLTIWQIRIK